MSSVRQGVKLSFRWKRFDDMKDAILNNASGDTYNFYISGGNAKEIADEVEQRIIQKNNRKRLAWQ